jgi:hypothetical protein
MELCRLYERQADLLCKGPRTLIGREISREMDLWNLAGYVRGRYLRHRYRSEI